MSDEEQQEDQEEASSSEEDELASVLPLFKKRLRWLFIVMPIGLLLALALLAASIYVVIYSGSQSMRAFEDLPSYRINLLTKGYREAGKEFDSSMESSRTAFVGDKTWELFQEANSLSDFMLAGEESQLTSLLDYRKAMVRFADRAGGTLEWKRYFLAQIDTLIKNSRDRKELIIAFSGQFPSVEPEPDPMLEIDE